MRRRPWMVVALILVLGTFTYLPSLLSPFLLDDYLHMSMVAGTFPSPRSPFNLYDFVNDADRPMMFARGLLPWWTHPRLTIRFLRPLSSAIVWADHRLFGTEPFLLHLQSFAWWVAAVLAVRALYRRTLPSRVTDLATAIFALGAWHAIPLAWLANCEALVSLVFGLLALAWYVRWREEGAARHGLFAGALFTLAMLAGEYALCFGGYVLALELVAMPGAVSRRPAVQGVLRRLVGLSPFALPAAGYLLTREALGYATAGSGFYSDPLHEPLAFLQGVPWRLSALLADGWLTIDHEAWGIGWGRVAAGAVVALSAVVLAGPIRRALDDLAPAPRHTAKWMLLGSLLAVIPVLAVVPSARLLGVSALGIGSTVALLLDRAWFPASREERTPAAELAGFVAMLLGFAHLIHGPGSAWLEGRKLRRSAVDFIANTAWLRSQVPDPDAAEVVVIRAGGGMFFGPFAVAPRGRPPARWRTLSHTGHALVLRRDERTLDVVVPPDKSVYPAGAGNLFRSPHDPLRAGDQIELPGMAARVLEVGENGPVRVRFTFDRELESPSLVWTAEDSKGFREAEVPKVGFGAPFDP